MIKSSFKDNTYSDFVNDFNLDLMSTSSFSYWSVKIYDINLDLDNMYNTNYELAKNKNFNSGYKNKNNLVDDFFVDPKYITTSAFNYNPKYITTSAFNYNPKYITTSAFNYNPKYIFDRFTIFALDGTVINYSIDNLKGKNICSITSA
jgi:hypothetical protein